MVLIQEASAADARPRQRTGADADRRHPAGRRRWQRRPAVPGGSPLKRPVLEPSFETMHQLEEDFVFETCVRQPPTPIG